MAVVGVFGDAELGAQLRHARIFRRDRRPASWWPALNASAGPSAIVNHRSVALAAQLGELRLQFAVELRAAGCSRRSAADASLAVADIRQHFGWHRSDALDRGCRPMTCDQCIRPLCAWRA